VRPSARRILIQTSGKRRSVRFSVVGLVSVMVELALCYRACEWRSVRLCRGKRTTLGLMAGSGICDNVLVASAIEWPPWLGLEPATVWEYLVAGSPYFTIAPTLSLILIWTDNRFVLLLIVVSRGGPNLAEASQPIPLTKFCRIFRLCLAAISPPPSARLKLSGMLSEAPW
jgi:hypothetical protein